MRPALRQLNAQLDPPPPPRPRRRGLGDGLADFNALMSSGNQEFSNSWGQINQQLSYEYGQGAQTAQQYQNAVLTAQTDFAGAYDQIAQIAQAPDPINAALQYVVSRNTVAGALQQVTGLIGPGQNPAATLAAQQVIGSMLGTVTTIAIGAGVLSAGVGAAIVAGVTLAIDVMESLGLFGKPPAGVEICPGVYVSSTPDWVYNCCGGFSPVPKISPGSPLWRRFPDPTNPTDVSAWYTANAQVSNWGPAGAPLSIRASNTSLDGWALDTYVPQALQFFPRMLALASEQNAINNTSLYGVAELKGAPYATPASDYFLSKYAQTQATLGALKISTSLNDFQNMFFQAWKANQEYALNGLTPQPDSTVLLTTIHAWNRAHPITSPYNADGSNPQCFKLEAASMPSGGWGAVPYEMTLVNDVLAGGGLQPNDVANGNALNISVAPRTSISFVGGGGPSTGQIVTAAVAGAAVASILGVGAYATIANVSLGYAAGKAFDALFGWTRKL